MNIPDTLYIKPCSQTTEMALKYFASTVAGSIADGSRYDLGITMLTFQPIPGRWGNQPQPEPVIKIKSISNPTTSPVTIVEALGDAKDRAAYFVENDTIYYIRSALVGSTATPPNYAVSIMLSDKTVTLSAYGAEYTYTFPASSNLQAWGAILQTGIVQFQKTE